MEDIYIPQPTKYVLKARTRTPITVNLDQTKLTTGYLPRIQTPEHIFIGEAIVTNENNKCYVMAINAYDDDAEIIIPPQILEPYDFVNESEDFFDDEASDKEPIVNEDRLARIIETLRLDHLNTEEREHVIELISEYQQLFHLAGDKLPATDVLQHSIYTTDNIPVFVKQYRYPPIHKEEIQRQVTKLLNDEIIEESTSPYNSPLWIVPKKADSKGNKRWRMVIDYRALNEKTIGDAHPLPNITEILDRLGGAKYFSIFDLASGFHQIEMDPKDRHKTAFSTATGHYHYIRMPFGLKNAPATFQRLMNLVLLGLQDTELLVYLDDVIIFAASLEEHGKKMRRLFDRLMKARLSLQPDKCEFLATEVEYLGHVITEDGVKPDPKKTEAVRHFPCPKSQTNIRQFLGLAGYYRKFIENFSARAKPLSDLLKKGIPFKWTELQQNSFDDLKKALCEAPVLQHPDFSQPFVLTTDASDFAVGAVLSQGKIGEDRPIAYMSHIMKPAEKNYGTTEKECLAVIYAVLHFRPYLYGREFTLISDHEPLKWIDSVKPPVQRLIRWRTRLREYQYKFLHKPGRFNNNADALSRNPIQVTEETAVALPISSGAKPTNSKEPRQATSSVRARPEKVGSKTVAPPTAPTSEVQGNTIAERVRARRLNQLLPSIKNRKCDPLKQISKSTKVTPMQNSTKEATQKQTITKTKITAPIDNNPKPIRPVELRNQRKFTESESSEGEAPPVARKRVSGFPSLISAGPPIRCPVISEEEDSGKETSIMTKPHNKNIKEISNSETSDTRVSDEYWWDNSQNTFKKRQGYHPLARSTPIEQEFLNESDSGTEDHYKIPTRLKPIMENKEEELSTDDEEPIERLSHNRPSETIPPGIFYPNFMKAPDSKLQIKLINHSITHKSDNIVHFISADCEFTTLTSKLLMDIGKIDKANIKEAKPKQAEIIVTPRTKTKVFSAVLKNKHFEDISIEELRQVLKNLGHAIENYNIKTLRLAKSDIPEKFTFSIFLDILKETLKHCDCTIYVCYGNTTIPPDDIRNQIIEENHDSLIGGHKGVTKTYRRIREKFFWPGMKEDVTEYIRQCRNCQEQKLVRVKNKEPMIITDTPIEPFDKISIDTVGPLPITPDGNKHILTIQDNLTKYCIAIPISDTKAETIADALARHVIALYGAPRIILSDKAPSLIGKVMQQLAKVFKIKQVTTSGYHPQSNGSLERSHITLTEYIKHYIEKYEDWDKVLSFATFSYNTSVHESTNFTPFELIFGKPARTPTSLPMEKIDTYNSYMTELIEKLNDIRTYASKNLIDSKHRSKRYYDRNAKSCKYEPGDFVYIQKEPKRNKLDKSYKGPHEIINILDKHNVVLQDESGNRYLKHMDKIKLAH